MIVFEIDIENVAAVAMLKPKRKPPIAADRHSKAATSVSGKPMKAASATQIIGTRCCVQRVED